MVSQIVIALILIILAIGMLKYTEPVANTFGKNDLAERYLGGGGTYTMWKILGIIFIIAAVLVLFGDFPVNLPSFAPEISTQSE